MSFESDLPKYAPKFTEADEWYAHAQGWDSALEFWISEIMYKNWTHYAEATTRRGKAQAESDLHSVGRPYDRLGAISEAQRRLPGSPDYVDPEPRPTKDPVTRAARIHGLNRYAERLMKAAERKGVPWRTALQGEGSYNADVAHLKAEWENVRKRLAVLGEDLDHIAEGIASGSIEVTEQFEPDIEPDDPELRRVYEAWERDQENEEADSADAQTRTDDDTTENEWMAERNDDEEVEYEPIDHGGPNGYADRAWRTEPDAWRHDIVYSEWSDEDE